MTTLDYSTLLALAEAESFGQPYLARTGKSRLPAVLAGHKPTSNRNPLWSHEERAYLKQQIGHMTDHEIGAALGRTADAIKIKRTRWGLPAHSRRPGWLTGHQVAKILNVDVHNIMTLTRRNILPHHRIPGQRGIINVRKITLYRWAVNPKNWIYFNPSTVRDLHLARLIMRQQSRWADEWWTVGQTAAYHQCSEGAINKAIASGRLQATRWGNHYILRSQALALKIYPGKGHGHEIEWSDRQDTFIVLASAVGIGANWISRKCGQNHQTIWYRMRRLHDLGQLAGLIQRHNLPVEYDSATGQVFADWRYLPNRFPALRQAMSLLTWSDGQLTSTRPVGDQVYLIRGVLARWMDWHGIEGPRQVNASYSEAVKMRKLGEMLAAIIAHTGSNPLEVL